MVKKSIFVVVLFVAVALSACAQQSQQTQDSCNKYSEPSLGISFCAPPKWTITKNAGETYQKAIGEKKEGLVPTISISTDNSDLTLKEFTNKGIEEFTKDSGEKELRKKGYSSVKLESQSEFAAKTTQGYRIVYNAEVQGRGLRLIQYAFAGKGNTKIVVTAYCIPSDKDVLDRVFDDSMKTFEVSQ